MSVVEFARAGELVCSIRVNAPPFRSAACADLGSNAIALAQILSTESRINKRRRVWNRNETLKQSFAFDLNSAKGAQDGGGIKLLRGRRHVLSRKVE